MLPSNYFIIKIETVCSASHFITLQLIVAFLLDAFSLPSVISSQLEHDSLDQSNSTCSNPINSNLTNNCKQLVVYCYQCIVTSDIVMDNPDDTADDAVHLLCCPLRANDRKVFSFLAQPRRLLSFFLFSKFAKTCTVACLPHIQTPQSLFANVYYNLIPSHLYTTTTNTEHIYIGQCFIRTRHRSRNSI